jgi:cytochrome c5
VAGAPKLGDAEAWKPRIDKGMEVLVEHAITGFQGESGVMPPKGGNPNLSDEDVEAAVAHMVEAAGGDTGEVAAADSGTDQPQAEDSGQPQSQAADASQQAQAPAGEGGQAPQAAGSGETGDQATDAGSDQGSAPAAGSPDVAEAEESPSAETLAAGERVYPSLCPACHAAGVAGAPKMGDAGAWAPRIDKGVDTLVNNAINGMQGDTGVMPPKGGNPGLSDEEVEAAVRYMVEESRQGSAE